MTRLNHLDPSISVKPVAISIGQPDPCVGWTMKLGRILLGWLGFLLQVSVAAGGFEAGNLGVVRVGDGRTSLEKASATAVFLDEINPSTGQVVRSIPLPTEPDRRQKRLTLSSTATSEGELSLSLDNRYLTLAGYDAPVQMVKVPGSPSDTVARVIARIDASGRVDTSTAITDGYSKNNVRGAVTADGQTFYVAGAGTGGGSRLVEFGSTGASVLLSPSPDNTRAVLLFDGRLYASVASGTNKGIFVVGNGIPIEEGQPSTLIAPAPVVVEPKLEPKPPTGTEPLPEPPKPDTLAAMDPKPTGFVFLGDRLYVADLESGLLVYEADGAIDKNLPRYQLKSKHGPTNLACLTGQLVDGHPVLYGTDGERLLRFTFDGPNPVMKEVARAGPNQVFRGVAFVPTVFDAPLIPLPVVIVLGTLGLLIPASILVILRRKARRPLRFDGGDIVIEGEPIQPV